MNLKNNKIKNQLMSLISPMSDEAELDIDKHILSAKFLSEIQKHLETADMKKKDFAELMDVSASFITQLFTGDKMVSMEFLSNAQKKLNIEFTISSINYSNENILNGEIKIIQLRSSSIDKKVTYTEYPEETFDLNSQNINSYNTLALAANGS